MWMAAYTLYSVLSGFFHSAWLFWNLSTVWHTSIIHPFLFLSSITLNVLRKTVSMTLVKMVNQTLFRTIRIDIEITAVGFCSRRERLRSTPNRRKVDIYSQGANRLSVDGQLIWGNVRGEGKSWLKWPNKVLGEERDKGDQNLTPNLNVFYFVFLPNYTGY